MHRKKHISKPWNLKLNLFEKNLLFWSWLCKHQDEEICSLGRWIFYQGSKRKKIKADSWDLLETNNNSPLLKRIWFLHLRFVARSRNLEQVIDCCFPGKSHLFSRQLSHCNFFGKLLTQRPIGYKTQWFDQKSLWQKKKQFGVILPCDRAIFVSCLWQKGNEVGNIWDCDSFWKGDVETLCRACQLLQSQRWQADRWKSSNYEISSTFLQYFVLVIRIWKIPSNISSIFLQ